MPLHLPLTLLLLYIIQKQVSASLPSPHNVTMIAVNTDYMLHWDWNNTQLENAVTFSVDYVYNDQVNEVPYKRVCEGSREFQCNFSDYKLPFSGSYLIRVRADAEQQHSNWTQPIRFTPQEDVHLTPPRVEVKSGIHELTLTISKSVMSDVIALQYRVQYWESLNPEQKHMKTYESLHAPIISLKSSTEYCVQVSVFSLDCDNSSNYTSPQCVYTTGRSWMWLRILPVLCSVLLFPLLAFLYKFHKFRRKTSEFTTPESIQAIPSVPLLLEAQEESCTVAHVITPAIQPTHTLYEKQERQPKPKPEPQAPESRCDPSDGCKQDSDFSSGLNG